MGFYKFFTHSANGEPLSSMPKSKTGEKLKENKPNNLDKEYYSFLK